LIDEIDKSDVDLPNDLLNIFEEGEFYIPELARLDDDAVVQVSVQDAASYAAVNRGLVRCDAFPVVVMTSNGERDFPPAFLRRCVRLDLQEPSDERLATIVEAHLGADVRAEGADILDRFVDLRSGGDLATDQLLNAIFLTSHALRSHRNRADLVNLVLRHLTT
jgi:MoxR-like ATPase